MATPKAVSISLTPQVVNLILYGGDEVNLRLTVNNSTGAVVPLTGSVEAQIRSSRESSSILASFSTDYSDADLGIVYLNLSGDDAEALHGNPDAPMERFTGVWDVQWNPDTGRSPQTLIQGKVDSTLDVTRI